MDKKLLFLVAILFLATAGLGYVLLGGGNGGEIATEPTVERVSATGSENKENGIPTTQVEVETPEGEKIHTVKAGVYFPSPYGWNIFFTTNASSGAPVLVIDNGTVVRDGDGYKQPSVLAPSEEWAAQIHVDEDGVLSAVVEDPDGNKQGFKFKWEK